MITLQEGINIISREMIDQAKNHRISAVKRVDIYKRNGNIINLLEAVRLETIAESLEGLSIAMSVEKVKKWRDEHNASSC